MKIGGVRWKKYERILQAAAEMFARQPPPVCLSSGTADLPFLTISSFSFAAHSFFTLSYLRAFDYSAWQILMPNKITKRKQGKKKSTKSIKSRSKKRVSIVAALTLIISSLTLVYMISESMDSAPMLQFERPLSYEGESEDGIHIEKHFQGILKNARGVPNSVVELNMSVFDIKTKEMLHDTFVSKVHEMTAGDFREIILPINLNARASIPVDITVYLSKSDSELMDMLVRSRLRLTDEGIVDSEYAFMLFMKDANGNVFDTKGQMFPQECLNKEWIGESALKIFLCYKRHKLAIILSKWGLLPFN